MTKGHIIICELLFFCAGFLFGNAYQLRQHAKYVVAHLNIELESILQQAKRVDEKLSHMVCYEKTDAEKNQATD